MKNPFTPTEKDPRILAITAVSIFVSLVVVAWMDNNFNDPYLIASFGATAVLIYGAPKAPFSKPKNVFFGHLFSAIIGVTVAWCFGTTGLFDEFKWIAIPLAVMLAIITISARGLEPKMP